MNYSKIEERKFKKIENQIQYRYCYYIEFDFSVLQFILARKKNGSKSKITYNEVYIMLDTETSKDHPTTYDFRNQAIKQENHIVCWTLSIRAFHHNICTLRGSKPSEMMHCLQLIRENLKGDVIFIFVHNLPYDWQFIRRFCFDSFGIPKKQLNVKSHYPITIQFNNGIILRDSLILAGVSLEKWGNNLGIEHQKAIGCWNYNEIRHQNSILTDEELKYIEFDTLAGVECLNKLADNLGDTVVSLPFTNTGIVRRRIRKIGRYNYAKSDFNKQITTLDEYNIMTQVYHGGYTHANRHVIDWIRNDVKCYDFKSSYPYCMLTGKVPRESFMHINVVVAPERILKDPNNAYIFKFVAVNIRLRNKFYPMPALQFFKCIESVNAVKDNGRILQADYVEIYLNEIDLKIIYELYEADEWYCTELMSAYKGYMPRWFRDSVFDIFKEKCELEYQIKILKQGDVSQYNLIKAQLNSLYGMCVTHSIRENIIEIYEDDRTKLRESGEYYIEECDSKKLYDKFNKDRNNILPYIWGVYVTSYAMLNLFNLSNCIIDKNKHWLYSDTDSIYSDNWNEGAVKEYNEDAKQLLIDSGYGAVKIEDREYWLGIAEPDGHYDKFITQGAKRYCVEKDHKLKITVAGVPKKAGACCLRSIDDFFDGFIFYGQGTGKTTHNYIYADIHIDKNGNEVADSIDLTEADYTLSSVEHFKFNELFEDEVTIVNWFEDE